VLTSFLHCSLTEIIPEPNRLMIPRFVEMLTAIVYASLVLGRPWENRYHEVSVAPWPAHVSPASLTCSYQIRKRIAVQNHN